MGRKILFVTTDQQRYDSLGCNGGQVADTQVADRLAATGINYRRAMNQNVVCMPARSSILTGQYPRTHGVYANGVPLLADAASVAEYLHDHGYRTALLGKAHFEPAFDLEGHWPENRMANEGSTGPHRGFEHLELAMHGAEKLWHYGRWLEANSLEYTRGFYQIIAPGDPPRFNDAGYGDTGLLQTAYKVLTSGSPSPCWPRPATASGASKKQLRTSSWPAPSSTPAAGAGTGLRLTPERDMWPRPPAISPPPRRMPVSSTKRPAA